jgi:hypothetical protein
MIKVFKEDNNRNYFTVVSPMGQELLRSSTRDRASKVQKTLESLIDSVIGDEGFVSEPPLVVVRVDPDGFDYVELVARSNNTTIARSKAYFSRRAAEYCRNAAAVAIEDVCRSPESLIEYIDRTK